MTAVSNYIKIARPDHWVKNLFVLPGVPLALFFFPEQANPHALQQIVIGLLAACIIASSNYVLNELLDAKFDRFHPEKKHRPLAAGLMPRSHAIIEWLLLSAVGLTLGFVANTYTGWACVTFWLLALAYNIPPVRTKELPYLDVLSEAINNPVRLAIGWYATGVIAFPPLSACFAYWMFGAFLMATKRFAEYRNIGDKQLAAQYRRSFAHYDEERLIVGIVFYIAMFITAATVFIMQHKHELILTMPILAYLIAFYLYLGFQPNSPTQHPELLYKEKHLLTALILYTALSLLLFFVSLPGLTDGLRPLTGH